MVAVIVKVKLQANRNSILVNRGMIRKKTKLEHHNQQKNEREEDKGWLAILLLQLPQPYAALCFMACLSIFQTNYNEFRMLLRMWLCLILNFNILCLL